MDDLARYMTAAGNRQVFAYRFDWDEFGSILGFDLGKRETCGFERRLDLRQVRGGGYFAHTDRFEP